MSSARAQANHSLYLAKIQLASWQRALAAQDIPAATLTQAFLPGVREHLRRAYGWFLLAVSAAEQPCEPPPRDCAELSAVAQGKAVPPEIREFQQLEGSGWLAELLSDGAAQVQAGRVRGNLATATLESPGFEQTEHWLQNLQALFDRMSDSLDEY